MSGCVDLRMGKNGIDVKSQPVGNDYFFEKPPEDQPKARAQSQSVERVRMPKLRQQVGGTLDGTSYQLRKKADKQCEVA